MGRAVECFVPGCSRLQPCQTHNPVFVLVAYVSTALRAKAELDSYLSQPLRSTLPTRARRSAIRRWLGGAR